VVLVLGITGIVALFPTAIESGNKTVEDTYAATITQSVVDAISVGLRDARYSWAPKSPAHTRNNVIWTYFILNHDGVIDLAPAEPEAFETGKNQTTSVLDKVWSKDYCIILPQSSTAANTDPLKEPMFVYPVPHVEVSPVDPNVNRDRRSPSNLGNISFVLTPLDNMGLTATYKRETADGTPAVWFTRVFHLGTYRANPPAVPDDTDPATEPSPGDVRPEYKGEDIVASGTSTADNIALDPYPTYSYAFAIKRARIDTTGDGKIDGADRFSNSLYELRVFIFKNFDKVAALDLATTETTGDFPPVPKTNVPIKEFITLISI